MLAIGIDPGTAICGFGLVEMVGNKLTPIHYGAVFTDKDMLPELRLKKIYDELSVLLDEYRPDVMSVEQLFFNRNVTTAISVGQARGVALLTAANRGIQITEFTPMQIKQAVVGYGGANKEQVTFMVQKLLNIRTKPKPDDIADALSYQTAYEIIAREMMKRSHLLEHVGKRMLDALYAAFPQLQYAKIKISKMNPPLGGQIRCTSVTLEK